ncbi:MAG: D-aminoacyl-tRNA deacylase [Dehalococcoidia bacterium]|nr:D-aminoacyl-tRNA deacylase [Dehalococcoidia bacterium]
MKAVLQRVSEARVAVDGQVLGEIGRGLVILLGVARGDEESDARVLAAEVAGLRIFSDDQGKFNLSLLDTGGKALVISQFTLLASTRRGRRPSFDEAAAPGLAETLVRRFSQLLEDEGVPVETGRFGAHMLVTIQNDGPVTILLDSKELTKPRRSDGT